MMNRIRNVIFDFGAVIVDLDVPGTLAAFRAIGLDDVEQFIGTAHQQGLFHNIEKGLITLDQFYNQLRQHIAELHPGLQVTDQQIFKAWSGMTVGIPAYKLDYLRQLKERGYHVSILSNTNVLHWNYCKPMFQAAEFDIGKQCEWVWLSFEMHHVKPEPEIFAQLLSQSGYDPDQSLFVDDADKNCQVAETFGIHTFMPKAFEDWRSRLDEELARFQ